MHEPQAIWIVIIGLLSFAEVIFRNHADIKNLRQSIIKAILIQNGWDNITALFGYACIIYGFIRLIG
jgi:hypothetical protein